MERSLSKIEVKITVHGKGEAKAEILRHMAPLTVGALLRQMPVSGRVGRLGESILYITSQISVGVEKSRPSFSRGDIAVLPLNGSLCIFLKGAKPSRPMNPIGRVTSNMDMLEKAGPGDTVTLQQT